MQDRRPYWRPTPHVREGVGPHGLAAILMRNMVEAVAHEPAVLSASPCANGDRQLAFTMVSEISRILDDDMGHFVRMLARRAEVDWDHVRGSGRTKPVLVLDAHVTSRDNLSIRVGPGPLAPDGSRGRRSDWTRFPNGGHDAFQRPDDEVALIRDVDFLFWSRDEERPGRHSEYAWQTRMNILASLSGLVMAAWEHCKVALSEHYDVQEGHAPALGEGPRPTRGPDLRSLRLAPPRGSPEWEREREAAAAREQADALIRKREEAEVILRGCAGDPRVLVARWRGINRNRRSSDLLASALAKVGVDTSPFGAWSRFSRIEAALRTVDPGWDEAPEPTPAVVTRPVVETRAEAPVASAGDGSPPPPSPRSRPAGRAPRPEHTIVGTEEPDHRFYARLPRYAATGDELAALSVGSIDEMVDRINAGLRAVRRPRVTIDDFPTTGSRFRRLSKLHANLLGAECVAEQPSP